jgi:hypothetical protein
MKVKIGLSRCLRRTSPSQPEINNTAFLVLFNRTLSGLADLHASEKVILGLLAPDARLEQRPKIRRHLDLVALP